MKKLIVIILILVIFAITWWLFFSREAHWEVRSIDTMKYSRDPSREKLRDASFDKVIDQQMSAIARTGATHVGIGTPYDEEFNPILKRWVTSARKHKLKIWFRGNFSGWEGWFEYPKIDRKTHLEKTEQFIVNNSDLFRNGDIFTSCPECENGPKFNYGDAREVQEYRKFLINEYTTVKEAFRKIQKNVKGNYYSMNGDVAKAVMDRETTAALDGIITIDHYVGTPAQLAMDIEFYALNSGGKVVLGEFGAPIPDINGNMSEEQQKQWLEEALTLLANMQQVEGINYWVNVGGSTALWREDNTPKPAVEVITKAYKGKLQK